MGKALQTAGGTGRGKLLNNWKQTKWLLELKDTEIVPTSRKRKADHLVVRSFQQKHAKLEEKFNETNSKLRDISNELESVKKANKNLSVALATNSSGVSHTPKRYKTWEEYTPQYKRVKKKQFACNIKTALSFMEDDNFITTEVKFKSTTTGEQFSVDSNGKTIETEDSMADDNIVQKTLYVKERFRVSNETYHELSMINPSLPSSSSILRAAKKLDMKSSIRLTPGSALGVQQSLRERLQKVISHLSKVDSSFNQNSNLKVKITGDGTSVSRSMHCVVIAFTIIRDVASPNSPGGNHTIAILNTTENYGTLAESLVEIADEIKQTQSIKVDTFEFTIEWFFTADLKYLAIAMGIEAANSRFACIWCKCPSEDRYDVTKKWSIQNENEGARTIENIIQCAKLPKTKKYNNEKCGCIRQPLFPSIATDHVVPDVLHLFLRVSDVLTNLLIMELRRVDGINKNTSYIDRYVKFLNEQCKVSFYMYADKETKKLQWRDLTGPEKIRVFNNFNFNYLFPDMPKVTIIQEIWKQFYSIYKELQSNKVVATTELNKLQGKLNQWMALFTSVYQTKHVTPYMHVMVSHIPEFLKLYGSIAPFSQQGLEKLNNEITKSYFRCTNYHDINALKQLLLKLNRLEELNFNPDCVRTKRVHFCRICKQSGHNCRTCPQNKPNT